LSIKGRKGKNNPIGDKNFSVLCVMEKKIYFASDFHFGIPNREKSLKREDLFVRWLDAVKKDALEIYLMGDLFDFWFEYKTAIPKGYVRLLGKLAEITDSGIPVHLFRGNHDMWAFNYLSEELGIILHRDPEIKIFGGQVFYLAHGDGLGTGDYGYKFIKKVFQSRINQWLFRLLHPDFGIRMALFWSRKSRYASEMKEANEEEYNLKKIRERLIIHSQNIIKQHPEVNYLIYGHYHLPYNEPITDHSRIIVLGDWLTHFTYAVVEGEKLELKSYFTN
jgi:UDP-2,3-diacylglucosamine hydrolase